MSIQYIRSGDYYIPDLKLSEEARPIGKWGRMHREYLEEHHPIPHVSWVEAWGIFWHFSSIKGALPKPIQPM